MVLLGLVDASAHLTLDATSRMPLMGRVHKQVAVLTCQERRPSLCVRLAQ